MSEELKKMILSKWRGKITYPFNYGDFEELKELIDFFEKRNNNLQQRIDEAIEYLKETTCDFGNDEMIFDKCDAYKLLSILQGKEVK